MGTQDVLNILAGTDAIVHKLYLVLVGHVVLSLSFRLRSEVAVRVSGYPIPSLHGFPGIVPANPQLRHFATSPPQRPMYT
jgi:hypothetical protein